MQLDLSPLNLTLYGTAFIGLLLGVYRLVLALRSTINIPMMSQQIGKLVAANNIDRALKLCNAVPQATFSRILRPALEAVLELEDPNPQTQAACLEDVFTQNHEKILAQEGFGALVSLAAVVLGALPPIIAFARSGAPQIGLIIVGSTAAVAGFFAWQKSRQWPQNALQALPPLAAALRKRSKAG